MRHLSSLVSSSACATIVALFASSAAAHIELVEPSPRYELPANKSCPCGDGDSNRTCNETAAESTDARAADAAVEEASALETAGDENASDESETTSA